MLPSAEPRAQRLLLPPRCLLGGLPWCWRVRCAPWPHPYPVWGSQDRKCPLRVWPAIQPHSPRLGGAETACFYVLIPSLKCVQTQASMCPASYHTAFLSCGGQPHSTPGQHRSMSEAGSFPRGLPLPSASLDLYLWGGRLVGVV